MENQINYSSLDFDYDFKQVLEEEKSIISSDEEVEKDILKDNSTESLSVEKYGLKPTREIIRGSVVYEQDGNNN